MPVKLRLGPTSAGLRAMLFALLCAGVLTVALAAQHGRGQPAAPSQDEMRSALQKLPLSFIKNQGQADRRVSYYVQGAGTSLYFTPQGVTYALTSKGHGSSPAARPGAAASRPTAPGRDGGDRRWAVRQEFVGANPGVRPSGQDLSAARVNYFKGPRSQWKTGLPTYSKVAYRDLWPGIDLVYSGNASKLEYTLVVKPGADPRAIELAYRGASSVELNEAGQLAIKTPVGGFRDDRPFAYQEVNGKRQRVRAGYSLARALTGTASTSAPTTRRGRS